MRKKTNCRDNGSVVELYLLLKRQSGAGETKKIAEHTHCMCEVPSLVMVCVSTPSPRTQSMITTNKKAIKTHL